MKKNKIFISGSNGFVGKHFINLLKTNNFNVKAPNKKELNLNNLKKTKKYISNFNPEFIVHLASRTVPNINSKKEFNKQLINTYIPAENIALSANKSVKIIIGVGSIEEYGNAKTPFKETFTPLPKSSYGIAKYLSYLQLKNICTEKKIKFIWLRPSLIFGSGMNSERLIGNFIKYYKLKKNFVLKDPNSIRDHLYVKDFCKIIFEIIKNHSKFRSDIFNVTSNNHLTNSDLIYKILENTKNKISIIKKSNKYNKKSIYVNSGTKINKKLNSFKYTPLKKALKETLQTEGLT